MSLNGGSRNHSQWRTTKDNRPLVTTTVGVSSGQMCKLRRSSQAPSVKNDLELVQPTSDVASVENEAQRREVGV